MAAGYNVAIIDLETLSLYDDAIILSLGMVVANLNTKTTFKGLLDKSLFVKFDALEQKRLGRAATADTIQWWTEQEESVKILSYYPDKQRDVSIKTMSDVMLDYISGLGIDPQKIWVWSRSVGFEKNKINHVQDTLNLKQVFNYKKYLDIVTGMHLTGTDRYAGISPNDFQEMVYHHPTHDCVLDFLRLQKAMSDIGMIELESENYVPV